MLLRRFPLILFAASCLTAGPPPERGSRAEYVGGTVRSVAQRSRAEVRTTDQRFVEIEFADASLSVPYDRVNTLEYGQQVDRRYALGIIVSPLLLLSKKRQHFLTIGYSDEEGRQQALVFKVNKGDIRALLVSLEARTGRRVVYQDQEARKAGKG